MNRTLARLRREAKKRERGDVPSKSFLLDSGATGTTVLYRNGAHTKYVVVDQVNTSLTFTSEDFNERDELIIVKQSELGELTVTGTQNIITPDGTTSLSYSVPDGTDGSFTLIFQEDGTSYVIGDLQNTDAGGSVGQLVVSSAGLGFSQGSGAPLNRTISCPVGKRIRVTLLGNINSTQNNGISLTVGGRSVISSKPVIGNSAAAGTTSINVGQIGGASSTGGYNMNEILGGVDEDFVFTSSVNLSSTLICSYQIVEEL